MKTPSREELLKLERDLKEIERRKTEEKLSFYTPYPKQQEFHDAGAWARERLFMAANQVGKTYCGSAEAAMHLTGEYIADWMGKKWDRPTRGWVAGVTGESTRNNPQRLLIGEIATGIGTGLIPKRCLVREKMTLARGVSDLFDTVLVKHFKNGKQDGWSELKFMSYERGREKWQGDTLDWIWFDEEPPEDVYQEGLTRLREGGMVFVTFTPLLGRSKVVLRYINEKSPDRCVTNMTLDDAKHFSEDEKKKRLAGYAEHERDARARGTPLLGSGQIFPYDEKTIAVDDFKIPLHWSMIWGFDFGLDHPFAAALMAWDKDTDTIYVTKCIRIRGQMPLQHAAAIKPCANGKGWNIPVAWPQDGWQRREFDGDLTPLSLIYKRHGLKMLPEHAKFPDGSNSTEAGIMEMGERMLSNRLKVFKSCSEWFEEYRLYHREDGQIVKLEDDLMSATRVGVMAKRFAKPVLFNVNGPGGGAPTQLARDVDIDPWL